MLIAVAFCPVPQWKLLVDAVFCGSVTSYTNYPPKSF